MNISSDFKVVLKSTITCPHCRERKAETMPAGVQQWFYECSGCGMIFRPLEGDCCVFCSYGTQPCPSVQMSAGAAGE
ncbi:MAG TPA: hypothetical protein ENK28_12350 [Aliiroseovarius sp.]|nr:hypothetical protein [Aliiroseovarius sp.]